MKKNIDFLKVIAEPLGTYISKSQATGQCFISGYIISNALIKAGYNAKMVTGHLIISDRKMKKHVYGSAKFGKKIGEYHTWCQVEINDEEYIIDASLHPNQKIYKSNGINIDKKFETVMVQLLSTTYPFKYLADSSLDELPKKYIDFYYSDETRKQHFDDFEEVISQRAEIAIHSF